jgi:Cytochrome c7 and related cytochrome c
MRKSMKKITIFFWVTVILVSTVSWAIADQGPETIDLKARYKVEGKKKAVIFPHHKHQEKLECVQCHKDAKGGGPLNVDIVKLTTSKNDFHKKFCWPCHKEMNVPKGKSCKTCHH